MKIRSSIAVMLILAFGTLMTAAVVLADDTEAPAKASGKSTRPPKNLKKMADGHWTPWDPPVPPDGANVHVIEKGDTLWDLSAKHLGNPYLWPQIWDQNRYVLDSHWIYPGDPIILPALEVVPENPTPVAEVPVGGGEQAEEKEVLPPPPPQEYPIGDRRDLYCSTTIHDGPLKDLPAIVAAEKEVIIGLAAMDVVYINAGSNAGVKPGDRFTIKRDNGEVKHPVTHEVLGHRIDRMGELTVIAVQENAATAEITFSCEDIKRTDMLEPYAEIPMTTRTKGFSSTMDRYNPRGSGKSAGYVVMTRDPLTTFGTGNVVSIDLGSREGLKQGDFLTIFRPNPEGHDLPRVNLGEAVVLMPEDRSSVVKITTSVKVIYLGDRVEVR